MSIQGALNGLVGAARAHARYLDRSGKEGLCCYWHCDTRSYLFAIYLLFVCCPRESLCSVPALLLCPLPPDFLFPTHSLISSPSGTHSFVHLLLCPWSRQGQSRAEARCGGEGRAVRGSQDHFGAFAPRKYVTGARITHGGLFRAPLLRHSCERNWSIQCHSMDGEDLLLLGPLLLQWRGGGGRVEDPVARSTCWRGGSLRVAVL